MAERKVFRGFPVSDTLPRLHGAVINNDQSLLRRELKKSPDVNVYWDGEMPLHVACRLGHYYFASTLLEHGASVTAPLMYRSIQPLGVAIENGHTEIAKLMVDKGRSLEGPLGGIIGMEGLLICAAIGDLETHSYLLKQGCIDINYQTTFGWTALRCVINYGRKAMVKQLLDAGADPQQLHPIHLAIYRQKTAIVKMLTNHNVDVNTFNVKRGGYPIHMAIETDKIEIVRMILAAKCDLTSLSKEGKTPLYLAAELGYKQIMDDVLMAGADLNVGMPETGDCPLMAAMTMPVQALYLNPNKPIDSLVYDLIHAGADVNCKNLNGLSPFSLAITKNLFRVAMMLMVADCNVELPKAGQKLLIEGITSDNEVDTEFTELYSAAVHQVLSLIRLCRRSIRSALYIKPLSKAVDLLPIPAPLKDFLLIPELRNFSGNK